jgi:hypothetical protein
VGCHRWWSRSLPGWRRRWSPRCAPRGGNAGSARGAASLLTHALVTAKAAGATGMILVRADSPLLRRHGDQRRAACGGDVLGSPWSPTARCADRVHRDTQLRRDFDVGRPTSSETRASSVEPHHRPRPPVQQPHRKCLPSLRMSQQPGSSQARKALSLITRHPRTTIVRRIQAYRSSRVLRDLLCPGFR